MRAVLFTLTLLFLSGCGGDDAPIDPTPKPTTAVPSADAFYACLHNPACEREAVRAFTHMAQYSAIKHASTTLAISGEDLLDPTRYWPLMAQVNDCSILPNNDDQQLCTLYQSHATAPIETCMAMPSTPPRNQIGHSQQHLCVQMKASQIATIAQCDNPQLTKPLQANCRASYKAHHGIKACAELAGPEKDQCLQQAPIFAAKDLSHCWSPDCIRQTYWQSYARGQKITCDTAPTHLQKTCVETLSEEGAYATTISACQSYTCLNQVVESLAFNKPQAITTHSQLVAYCATASSDKLSNLCLSTAGNAFARANHDVALCNGEYTLTQYCFREIIHFLKLTDPKACDNAGHFARTDKDKRALKTTCLRSQQDQAAIDALAPSQCTSRYCFGHITLALTRDIADGKPAQYDKCKAMGRHAAECKTSLEEQSAFIHHTIALCHTEECFSEILALQPNATCQPLQKQYQKSKGDTERQQLRNCLNMLNTRQALALNALLLCSTRDCVNTLLKRTKPDNCNAVAPPENRVDHIRPELEYYEQKELHRYCKKQLDIVKLDSKQLKDCRTYSLPSSCLKTLVAHHNTKGTLAKLNSADCELFANNKSCYRHINPVLIANKDITQCRSRQCFMALASTAFKQGPLSLNCDAYAAPEICRDIIPTTSAAMNLDLSHCNDRNCVESVVEFIGRRHVAVDFIHTKGVPANVQLMDLHHLGGLEIATLKASTFKEWQARIKEKTHGRQAAYESLWVDPIAQCQTVKGDEDGYPLALICEQYAKDQRAIKTSDFSQCGTHHCLRALINSIPRANDCERLDPRYRVHSSTREPLQEFCKTAFLQHNSAIKEQNKKKPAAHTANSPDNSLEQ